MILPAQAIRALCRRGHFVEDIDFGDGSKAPRIPYRRPMLEPFAERTAVNGMSYGLSSSGYDVRIAETIWLWPFWGRLASTIERFDMPNDVVARVCDKSSWARRFVFVQNTVIEPSWKGWLTLELTRMRPWPVRIKAGTPIAQILFERLEEATEQPYQGRYQNQERGPQAARTATSANVG